VGRSRRTDLRRAALLLWGGWLLTTALVFSLMAGIFHAYYTVALAPAIAALVAISAGSLWRRRSETRARVVLAIGVLATSVWAWVLLDRTPQWESWLRVVIAISAAVAIIGLLAAPSLGRFGRRARYATAAFVLVACLSGPIAYSAQTIGAPETGALASAGPSSRQSAGGPGSHGGGDPQGSASTALAQALESQASRYRWVAAVSGSQSAASLELATGGAPVMAIGGFDGEGGNLTLAQFKQYVARGQIHYYIAARTSGGSSFTGPPAARSNGRPARGPGGPFTGARPGGGALTGAPGRSGSSSGSQITNWVKAHYKSQTIGGKTVYNLTQPQRS
jgi:4-amino-4-deoxy-L-arabinose transferase-like glycosyltransferase